MRFGGYQQQQWTIIDVGHRKGETAFSKDIVEATDRPLLTIELPGVRYGQSRCVIWTTGCGRLLPDCPPDCGHSARKPEMRRQRSLVDPLPPVASVCFREAHFRLLPYAAGARAS